jgi:ribonuclease BN (tRNA processing enzyme)
MAALGLPWDAVSHVALTHFHADHTSDLATLLFAWRWGLMPARTAKATILGPAGTRDLLGRHAAALGESMLEAIPDLEIVEIEPDEVVTLASGVSLEACKVPHTDESVAYSLSWEGRRVVITGDTAFHPDLGKWSQGCDLLISECSLPDDLAHASHLTPRQCGALAALAQPQLFALTHFYPPVEQVDILTQVREQFSGPVALCFDGWTHEI